jgi:hypothetical protein
MSSEKTFKCECGFGQITLGPGAHIEGSVTCTKCGRSIPYELVPASSVPGSAGGSVRASYVNLPRVEIKGGTGGSR